ncbi:hypothetical protein HYT56_03790 [Candidatus Woesearchaeota archaeon]|nr:hypothetical protein [Candidatus Woesearchaeota archaeon]
MKKFFIIFGIFLLAFLVIGAGCSKEKPASPINIINGPSQNNDNNEEKKADFIGDEGRVLVDRVRYVQAGNAPFDFTNVIFAQKKNAGYKVEVNSDRDLKIEVMTDKDCLLKAQGDEYKIIDSDEGSNVMIVDEKLEGESRNLCVGATASGTGEVEIKFKVTELI